MDGWTLYVGKVGADNVLLMVVGALHVWLWILKRRESHYKRLRLELLHGLFFIGYGFCFDLYRIRYVRKFILWSHSFVIWHTVSLFIFLLPVFFQVVSDIYRVYYEQQSRQ